MVVCMLLLHLTIFLKKILSSFTGLRIFRAIRRKLITNAMNREA